MYLDKAKTQTYRIDKSMRIDLSNYIYSSHDTRWVSLTERQSFEVDATARQHDEGVDRKNVQKCEPDHVVPQNRLIAGLRPVGRGTRRGGFDGRFRQFRPFGAPCGRVFVALDLSSSRTQQRGRRGHRATVFRKRTFRGAETPETWVKKRLKSIRNIRSNIQGEKIEVFFLLF